jgi:hypothetical protein
MSYTEAKRLLEEQKRKRDEYIRKVAERNPDWSYQKIADEVKRVFGECNKMDVSRALRN